MNELLAKWIKQSIQLTYARFQQPVPTGLGCEPVFEFALKDKQAKYLVDEMYYTPHGFIWKFKNEWNILPLPNVHYVRTA